LRDRGVLDDDRVAAIRTECMDRVEEAVAFAKNSPMPDPAGATSYVFA
jgi:pyruvate dehydrogenase E1 component alpha subunit